MKWLGIGPGRCGTQSLAKIFGADHELFRPSWERTVFSLFQTRTLSMFDRAQVGWPYLSVVHHLRTLDPDLPIVNMRRTRDACVGSHLRICAGLDRLSTYGRSMLDPQDRNLAYPHVANVFPGRKAWEHWYDLSASIMSSIPGAYDIWVDDLNDPDKLADLQRWLESKGVEFPEGFVATPCHVDVHGHVVK